MPLSVFDLFRIGVGPSSSHTVGPMRIARGFAEGLSWLGSEGRVSSLEVHLYGSLALTGRGHGTDRAVVWGLLGYEPESIEIDAADVALDHVRQHQQLRLFRGPMIAFNPQRDIHFHPGETLPQHPNGMRLVGRGPDGRVLSEQTAFSVGGGFVRTLAQMEHPTGDTSAAVPYSYATAEALLGLCEAHGLSIADLALANEVSRMGAEDAVLHQLDRIWAAMAECMDRGLSAQGTLPGPLKLPRRAQALYAACRAAPQAMAALQTLDWVNAFAVAVNEENAAGGRVVTAPTNGAAGVIPAVLRFHQTFVPGANQTHVRQFLLTAGAIGALYKENASISGAEVGCQGEVGVASSMAAAGLAAVMGGTVRQVENAAEIAMEHHLGMTCDPVAGLVQVPCIERNAMGAVKAINAARLALMGDGAHLVSLDRVIQTMRQTGADMSHKYKETSLGGLAVSVVAC